MAVAEAEGAPEVTPALLQVTRMILSGVARAHGRFGKNLVVGMLCGSQSAKIKKWRLDRLSTFGLLDRFRQTEVADIIDALIALSLIKMVEVDKFRPTIHNTDLGNEIMMGRAEMTEGMELERALLLRIERQFRGVPADAKASTTHQPSEPAAVIVPLSSPSIEQAPPTETETALSISGSNEAVRSDVVATAEVSATTVHPNYYWTWSRSTPCQH